MLNLLRRIVLKHSSRTRGQSFVELALILPVLLLMLLGLVEVAFFMSKYLDGLDLTREAARFASIRDPFSAAAHDYDCFTANMFDFFWDTSCIFSPPEPYKAAEPTNLANCPNPAPLGGNQWCNGLNKYLSFNPATDDVVITVFSIAENNTILRTYPFGGSEVVTDEHGNPSYYWALSNHIDQPSNGTAANPRRDNWKKNCGGAVVNNLPYFTQARIENTGALSLVSSDFPTGVVTDPLGRKGFVGVELYYCHTQVLGLPVFTIFIPNPIMMHVYTLMPLPAAAPTPTPIP